MMGSQVNVEQFLLSTVTMMADETGEVSVTSVITETGTVFQVTVARTIWGRSLARMVGQSERLGGTFGARYCSKVSV